MQNFRKALLCNAKGYSVFEKKGRCWRNKVMYGQINDLRILRDLKEGSDHSLFSL